MAKRSDDNWSVWSRARTEYIDWQSAEPSPSQTKQRKPTKHPSSKRSPLFNDNYISVHSRSFDEDPFVGNPSFNTNSLSAWVTAYLSGPNVPVKLRSCNHPVQKTKRKQQVVTCIPCSTWRNSLNCTGWMCLRGSPSSSALWRRPTVVCMDKDAPRYLADHIIPAIEVASRHWLLSANRHRLIVPRCGVNTYGRQA